MKKNMNEEEEEGTGAEADAATTAEPVFELVASKRDTERISAEELAA